MRYDERYYIWLISFIDSDKHSPKHYNKLLRQLHEIDFIYYYPKDQNRAIDGIDLRYQYDNQSILYSEEDTCSVLEMMIALAIRMERDIMHDDDLGDRTSKWFWEMIRSLGLIDSTDDNPYTENYIYDVIDDFMARNYAPNGYGGLFAIDDVVDIRDREIWYQMQMYLNYII